MDFKDEDSAKLPGVMRTSPGLEKPRAQAIVEMKGAWVAGQKLRRVLNVTVECGTDSVCSEEWWRTFGRN